MIYFLRKNYYAIWNSCNMFIKVFLKTSHGTCLSCSCKNFLLEVLIFPCVYFVFRAGLVLSFVLYLGFGGWGSALHYWPVRGSYLTDCMNVRVGMGWVLGSFGIFDTWNKITPGSCSQPIPVPMYWRIQLWGEGLGWGWGAGTLFSQRSATWVFHLEPVYMKLLAVHEYTWCSSIKTYAIFLLF